MARFGPRPDALVVLALLAAFVTACGGETGPDPEGLIDREVFIDAYVDLRVAALSGDSSVIGDAARVEILRGHGIEEDDLILFADAHGRDLEFMREVWNEVELRLDVERPEPESGEPGL